MAIKAERVAPENATAATAPPCVDTSCGLMKNSAASQQAAPMPGGLARDLQNILYSMNIAVVLLDPALTIRFFTPAIKRLFHIIPGDIGRPLSDLRPLAPDDFLAPDIASVLANGCIVEREIALLTGNWFARNVLPFRSDGNDIDGVVITYTDITQRKCTETTLQSGLSQADAARKAKSRSLAAASHDLQQPLQALQLVQGMLSRIVEDTDARQLVDRLEATLGEMNTMLNALRDIDQSEAAPARVDHPPFLAKDAPLVFLVDDDDTVRDLIRTALEDDGFTVEAFASGEDFLSAFRPGKVGCLLVDAYLPGMSGLTLLQKLQSDGTNLPSVMITGYSDVAMAVEAMKAGACDFIEKPLNRDALLGCIDRAFRQSRKARVVAERSESASLQLASLTPRQRQILQRVLAGQASKNIASDLHISQRTVENHRAIIMKKTGSRSLPALARLALDFPDDKTGG